MSPLTIASRPVSRTQIDTAVRFLRNGSGVSVRHPFNLPADRIVIEIKGRPEVEDFMLRLAMIASGDALSDPVSGMPTVVDVQDVLECMEVFRDRLEELEDVDEQFLLTLELAK